MQHLSGLDLFFWVAGLILNAVLLLVLWVRHRAAEFPFFTALTTLEVVRTIALFFIHSYARSSAYFYAYWSLAFVDVALQLGVIYEITSHVFRPTGKVG